MSTAEDNNKFKKIKIKIKINNSSSVNTSTYPNIHMHPCSSSPGIVRDVEYLLVLPLVNK